MLFSHHISKHFNNVHIPNVLNLHLLLHAFHVTFNHNGTMKLFVHDYLHVSEDEYTPKQDADVFAYLLKCEKELIGT